jgi:hypothetical protein
VSHQYRKFSPFLLVALCGCASVKYGNKDAELELKKLQSIPEKVSLYVCRENAVFVGAGVRTIVYVDNIAIGTLKPNNFAHVVAIPGKHEVYIDRGGLSGNSGVLNIDTKESLNNSGPKPA